MTDHTLAADWASIPVGSDFDRAIERIRVEGVLYLFGKENVDGSLRLARNGNAIHAERRVAGAWTDLGDINGGGGGGGTSDENFTAAFKAQLESYTGTPGTVNASGTGLQVKFPGGAGATVPAATATKWGAMTDEDRVKLDGLPTAATQAATDSAQDTAIAAADLKATNAATQAAAALSGLAAEIGTTDTEQTAQDARLTALETDQHTHANKALLDLLVAARILPDPTTGAAGEIPLVNAAKDGYELGSPAAASSAVNLALGAADQTTRTVEIDAGTNAVLPATTPSTAGAGGEAGLLGAVMAEDVGTHLADTTKHLPVPAGVTDATKIAQVNAAGDGYELADQVEGPFFISAVNPTWDPTTGAPPAAGDRKGAVSVVTGADPNVGTGFNGTVWFNRDWLVQTSDTPSTTDLTGWAHIDGPEEPEDKQVLSGVASGGGFDWAWDLNAGPLAFMAVTATNNALLAPTNPKQRFNYHLTIRNTNSAGATDPCQVDLPATFKTPSGNDHPPLVIPPTATRTFVFTYSSGDYHALQDPFYADPVETEAELQDPGFFISGAKRSIFGAATPPGGSRNYLAVGAAGARATSWEPV